MVTLASVRMFKDFIFLFIALAFSSLFVFNDFSELLAVCQGRCYDLAVLAGIILLSSFIVHMVMYLSRDPRREGLISLFMSMVLATNVAFVIYWKAGLFMQLEEIVLMILCLFGVLHSVWIIGSTHWRRIPGVMQRVLIVGNGDLARDMRELAETSGGRYEFSDFIQCEPGDYDDPVAQVESPSFNILNRARELKANNIVVSMSERRGAFPLQEVLSCKLSGIEVMDAPEFYERVNKRLMLENIRPSALIFASGFKIIGIRRFIKRLMDIVLSLIGLIIVTPFFPLVALAIKLDSPGPIFFRQVRVGKGDQPFEIVKFRSMRQDAEKKSGAVWAKENDNRITKLGRFLRKSRIDELPQLVNVLFGSMSLVGPRPERPEFVQELKKIIPYYSERHFVKPGITGWAQVRYPYGASVQDAIEKLRYDLYYIKNYSLSFDLLIMFKTVSVMLKKMGR
ncbi:UDP-N-acetylgalactosamine-undecaprenyl-phosphate N-acetylgalactosaminephosphotransferase [Pseudodesulfovibrio profundus]|uniref:UDP-N-acetylgalactosamine-undecaprenyl-phosphate N-acetylgalactosaminephosphotransferase n=1 Tax=Pseudodesulfovibrio profundus TaxID=57320 RepID=A0A2C8F6A0_9BACT|nr:TIGR03013 family XrtA/PEP-CTERM system glycosyltransferase [Pseudodesulfovibrio profundus]MBC16712.1 glycosyl transferase [Desulfovibrio sp.]SOB58257.1 UDP-N-acetylgalactosamine-undecaprenyl-phosphate N-acetylgalactosaminephosphotransferase [Pseudodesulfovibrio profundus]